MATGTITTARAATITTTITQTEAMDSREGITIEIEPIKIIIVLDTSITTTRMVAGMMAVQTERYSFLSANMR